MVYINCNMEKFIFLRHPATDVRAIESMVRSADCFVALIEGDLYAIGDHLAADHFKFTATLDRNVYTRITALVSGTAIPTSQLTDYRCAAAILAFAKIADITFDYNSSLYEYASSRGGSEAVKELHRFRSADNADTSAIIDFALARTDRLPAEALTDDFGKGEAPPASEFERITYPYRINYTFALKIAELAASQIPDVKKMLNFLDWMEFEFILGSPATLFANRYFSPNRFGKMLKGRSRRGIMNAAWDLTLIQDWRKRALAGLENGNPAILITRDRAVKNMAGLITAETMEEFEDAIRAPWGRNTQEGKRVARRYMELHSRGEAKITHNRKLPNVEAQKAMMQDLERKLFGAET